MNKILNLLRWLVKWILNIVIAAGIVVILIWAIWSVPPQVSLAKTAYFLSDSWHFILGQSKGLSDKNKN